MAKRAYSPKDVAGINHKVLPFTGKWKEVFGVPLWGNLESTRYQPVGEGRLPAGAGRWVR